MRTTRVAFTGCPIFDGHVFRQDSALLAEKGRITGIVSAGAIPASYAPEALSGGFLTPGFVDLQVNGGGGVMLNDDPSLATIKTICAAHLPFGTTALLPTLISSTPEKTAQAIRAARAAVKARVSGCIGLHLEGPHLAPSRHGAHDLAMIRPMSPADLTHLKTAGLPSLLTTLAPENVTGNQIAELAQAGVIVSLGHSDCSLADARHAANQGATCVTHLFNAMSGLSHRAPGLVGAALSEGRFFASLIADGFHVDPAAIGIALRAKTGPGQLFLVSDAMATIGTSLAEFRLDQRLIRRNGGRLTLSDGTLAGADLTMLAAVRVMVRKVGVDLAEALRMASLYPATLLRREAEFGRFVPGARADILHCADDMAVRRVWQAGLEVTSA